ncbi:MAG TPA: matrixin family metalloprotease [Acidimicrobiales bacterium]|nr:matrixin family metalloprotease [Acidimicrobiales bacterium]
MLPPVAPPASAHTVNGRWPSEQWAYNESGIANVIGPVGVESLYTADWSWETTELWKWVNPYANNTTNSRNIYFDSIDGRMGGVWGRAATPCRAGYTCYMYFDIAERWNSTSELRDNNWMDFRSAATHEFGHWMGGSHSWDYPSTQEFPGQKAALYEHVNYGEYRRAIFQDDINAVKAARAYLDIVTANDSFEYGTRGFLLRRAFGQGSWTRYCDGGGYAGTSCYVQWNGTSNSIYQDVHLRGTGYNQNGARNMWGQGRFRNRSGLAGRQVQVVVWNIDSGTILANQICNLPIDASWVHCTTPSFRTGPAGLRVEYYNNTGSNTDLDIAILG